MKHKPRAWPLLLAIAVLAGLGATSINAQFLGNPNYAGCGFPPYTSCTNPIPATYLSGSWIEDDSASEWTLTGNTAKPGTSGSVSGTELSRDQLYRSLTRAVVLYTRGHSHHQF